MRGAKRQEGAPALGLADTVKRAEIMAELARRSKQHIEALRDATFRGWTRELLEEHERRAKRIGWLNRQLSGEMPNRRLR
jgi:hypothetical protein